MNRFKRHRSLNLRGGETVRVRGESEIARTLDQSGCLEGLPFMPEMKVFVGRSFRVLKRVDEMLIEGIGCRQIANTVILAGVTCDGKAHSGCARTCPILWKESWLKRIGGATDKGTVSTSDITYDGVAPGDRGCSCQLLSLVNASRPKYVGVLKGLAQYLQRTELGKGRLRRLPVSLLWLDSIVNRFGKSASNVEMLRGSLKNTPISYLNLRPGEHVEVKSKEEITATLDFRGRNRGLFFSPEMIKYCGRKFSVLKKVDKMFDENTGKMRSIANTVILKGVACDGAFHDNCPRNCYCLWREAWLKRSNNHAL